MIILMDIVWLIGMTFLGAVFGSFAGAQVWRLRARQLEQDKAEGGPYSASEYKRLTRLLAKKGMDDRSVCLHCGHKLAWSDLIPIASWIGLKGKCRYCGKKIGYFELMIELVAAGLFVASYLLWPFGFATIATGALFVVWLVAIVLLVILGAYDLKWHLLPDVINFGFIAVVALYLALSYAFGVAQFDIVALLGSLGALAGLYGVLYLVSGGRWIGFGDVKLSIGLALLLTDWKLAFFALFMANLIGCIIVLPLMVAKKLNAKSRIAFGPMLIAGTLIAFWFGAPFLAWFFSNSGLYL